jgi:hypothetical protein
LPRKSAHTGNFELKVQKLSAKVKAMEVAPRDISVVWVRGTKPIVSQAINGITKAELGIYSRYTIAQLAECGELRVETDVAGFRWLSPAGE